MPYNITLAADHRKPMGIGIPDSRTFSPFLYIPKRILWRDEMIS